MTTASTCTFDVFLSHNSRDKPAVERVAEKLRRAGLEPWFDRWYLTPGGFWQDEIVSGLRSSSAFAVFIGVHGLGDWVREELALALDRAAKDRNFRLFLVLLPGLPEPFDASTLPPFLSTRTWIDLRTGFEDARAFQALVSAIKGVPLGVPRLVEPTSDVCPYRGLQPFNEEHAQFFFGRDKEIQRLVEKLKGTRFLAVLGPSGSGKSSLVRAGLMPALRKGALPGSGAWAIRVFIPGPHPLTQLASQLLHLHPVETMRKTLDELNADERTMHLATSLALAERPASEHLVWVIDQFEEVFTLCREEQERGQFLANLLYATSIPRGRDIVIVTMRADFYPRCAVHPDLSQRVAAQQFLVGPMDEDSVRTAIEEPAWHVGLEFEQGLIDTILGDLASQPGALPLLEHALLELWERRRGSMLTLEAYRESGGVQGAIAKRADSVHCAFDAEEQEITRRVMLRLTQPGEGTEDTRRRAAMSELVTNAGTSEAVDRVVCALADARLLTTSGDEPGTESWVDVAHEALIRSWPRLQQWIEEDRAGLRIHRRLTEAAQEWQRNGRDEAFVYRGARLAAALEWRERNQTALNALEQQFLDASVALQNRERRARKRRRQAGLGGLIAALLAISTLAALALSSRESALHQRDVATANELAANATAQLQVNPELSVLLAAQAIRLAPTADAQNVLRQALLESHIRAVLHGHRGAVTHVEFSPDGRRVVTASRDKTARVWDLRTGHVTVLRGHTGAVNGATFSPNGRFVLTVGQDGTAGLWSSQGGERIATVSAHGSPITAGTFSPDGNFVVTGDEDSVIRIWKVEGRHAVNSLHAHAGAINDVQFSRDGRLLVTADDDGTAQVWQTGTWRRGLVLRGHTDAVRTAVFSPNGRLVATASWDHTAAVWDARTGLRVHLLRGHSLAVSDAAFSPDGKRLVTASNDGTVKVWGVTTGQQQAVLLGHTGVIYSALCSPDGRFVVTASGDHTARVWDLQTGETVAILRGHTGKVYDASFSPNGQRIITASEDGTARLWEPGTGQPSLVMREPKALINDATFSPDGQLVVTGSTDDLARIWKASTGQPMATLRGHTNWVNDAAFSLDGRYIVTTSDDGTARVWQTGSWRLVHILSAGRVPLHGAAFSPDGMHIATAADNGIVSVWQTGSWRRVATLATGKEPANSVAFSPDGRYLAAATDDGVAAVWTVGTWRRVGTLSPHTGAMDDVRFSADSRLIVTAMDDGTARIWKAGTWAATGVLRGHTAPVESATFSPNSQVVATASDDHTARIWDLSAAGDLEVLRGHVGTVESVTFSANGQSVLTAGDDGTAQIYACDVCGSTEDLLTLAHTRLTRELTDGQRKNL